MEILRENPDIARFLRSFRVKTSDKVEVFRQGFSGKIADEVLNTVSILLGHRRAALFDDLQEAYRDLVRESRNIVPVEAVSATPLSRDVKTRVTQTLEEALGKSVELSSTVDEAIIGGLKFRIQNKVYDGSIARQLERLKQQLT